MYINLYENTEITYIIRVIIAGILGILVGKERNIRRKQAGTKTYFVVATSATIMTCISLEFNKYVDTDASRIAAQIVSGIGFLGSGMIILKKDSLLGLTTAASIWYTAGIGMCCGSGLYYLAIVSTIFLIGLQIIFHLKIFASSNDETSMKIMIRYNYNEETTKFIEDYFKTKNLIKFRTFEESETKKAEIIIRSKSNQTNDLIQELVQKNNNIYFVEILE